MSFYSNFATASGVKKQNHLLDPTEDSSRTITDYSISIVPQKDSEQISSLVVKTDLSNIKPG